MLTRDQLLAAYTPPSETVTLPTMGGEVIMRGFTAGELIKFQRFVSNKAGDVDETTFGAKLLVRTIVDADGNRVLNDEDWKAVQGWPAKDFQAASDAAMRVCGYTDRSAEGN
jgi:hypothetical protein